jgi:predicted RNase H-like nuclease (RuvC/YqgF family)
MQNDNNVRQKIMCGEKTLNDEEQKKKFEQEQEDLQRDLERQDEDESVLVRMEREREDLERYLQKQEELDQEYGDNYKCMYFCGDDDEWELER